KSCARKSMSASLARLSRAGACNRTFNAPPISPATSSLLARGCTRTGKTTAPFLSCISSTAKLPGALVLDGRLDFPTQDLRRAAGPIGISQQFARHDHQRSEEHTSELQSRGHLVCRLLLEKKNYS